MTYWTHESLNQWANESLNYERIKDLVKPLLTNEWFSKPLSTNKSMNQWINKSHGVNEAVTQSLNQSISESVNAVHEFSH